jgi:hypothetical protein
MVHSLGVKIGGRNEPSQPMEMVRASLVDGRKERPDEEVAAAPTSNALQSKCPFTGVVADALAQREASEGGIVWTRSAEARLARIPGVAQPMVKMGIEMHAREHGYTEIDDAVMDEVKNRFGM